MCIKHMGNEGEEIEMGWMVVTVYYINKKKGSSTNK